jgi:hypothetical protein
VFGDRTVNAENDRLRFARQMGNAVGANFPFHAHFGDINYVGHAFLRKSTKDNNSSGEIKEAHL